MRSCAPACFNPRPAHLDRAVQYLGVVRLRLLLFQSTPGPFGPSGRVRFPLAVEISFSFQSTPGPFGPSGSKMLEMLDGLKGVSIHARPIWTERALRRRRRRRPVQSFNPRPAHLDRAAVAQAVRTTLHDRFQSTPGPFGPSGEEWELITQPEPWFQSTPGPFGPSGRDEDARNRPTGGFNPRPAHLDRAARHDRFATGAGWRFNPRPAHLDRAVPST